jgi:hypothetical protein
MAGLKRVNVQDLLSTKINIKESNLVELFGSFLSFLFLSHLMNEHSHSQRGATETLREMSAVGVGCGRQQLSQSSQPVLLGSFVLFFFFPPSLFLVGFCFHFESNETQDRVDAVQDFEVGFAYRFIMRVQPKANDREFHSFWVVSITDQSQKEP